MEPLLPLAFVWFVRAVCGGGEDLAEAKKLLAANEEASCRKGTEQCVAANDLEAVELLLDVLRQEADRDLPVAHYRDVVWGGLRDISDADGRTRVQTELEKNKKAPEMRAWSADLLGEYGEGSPGASPRRATTRTSACAARPPSRSGS